MDNEKEYFFCYSKPLQNYLFEKGIKYITRARHLHTNKVFTLYPLTKEVERHLNEYKQLNSN